LSFRFLLPPSIARRETASILFSLPSRLADSSWRSLLSSIAETSPGAVARVYEFFFGGRSSRFSRKNRGINMGFKLFLYKARWHFLPRLNDLLLFPPIVAYATCLFFSSFTPVSRWRPFFFPPSPPSQSAQIKTDGVLFSSPEDQVHKLGQGIGLFFFLPVSSTAPFFLLSQFRVRTRL